MEDEKPNESLLKQDDQSPEAKESKEEWTSRNTGKFGDSKDGPGSNDFGGVNF